MQARPTLYFHRDFDGAGSAAILGDFLQRRGGHAPEDLRFRPIGFELKERWVDYRLARPCAVLDFLFHPLADWWVDHHVTSFLLPEWRQQFRPSATRVWDLGYPSCCSLIADVLAAPPHDYRNSAFTELVRWGDIIDSARFDSVDQVLRCEEPALQINSALELNDSSRIAGRVARELMTKSLKEVADLPWLQRAFRKVHSGQLQALDEFRRASRIDDGVVQFDLRRGQRPIPRFAPYLVYPEARFVVGMFQRASSSEISVGSNPWKPFRGPNIGALCARFGGGGREQVGGITLRSPRRAPALAREVAALLRRHLAAEAIEAPAS